MQPWKQSTAAPKNGNAIMTTHKNTKIKGQQDVLEIFDDKITITPTGLSGLVNKGLKGGKTIPYRSITAIQFKSAGLFITGYIQFTIHGGNESKGGVLAAVRDENSFLFSAKMNAEMENVKKFIEEKMASLEGPGSTSVSSLADELTKLSGLRASGAISDAEFSEIKSQLIKRSAS